MILKTIFIYKLYESEISTLVVDASDDETWVEVSLTDAEVIDDGAADELSWDLGVQRTLFRTNGGTSGSRGLAVRFLEETTIEELGEIPSDGYAEDEEITAGGPSPETYSGNPVLADWYDYNMETHELTPKDGVFIVRLDDGGYGAIVIDEYDDGVFTLQTAYTGADSDEF